MARITRPGTPDLRAGKGFGHHRCSTDSPNVGPAPRPLSWVTTANGSAATSAARPALGKGPVTRSPLIDWTPTSACSCDDNKPITTRPMKTTTRQMKQSCFGRPSPRRPQLEPTPSHDSPVELTDLDTHRPRHPPAPPRPAAGGEHPAQPGRPLNTHRPQGSAGTTWARLNADEQSSATCKSLSIPRAATVVSTPNGSSPPGMIER